MNKNPKMFFEKNFKLLIRYLILYTSLKKFKRLLFYVDSLILNDN